jgi:hypothetical protein
MCASSSPPAPAAPDYTAIAAANSESAKYAKTAADNDLQFRRDQYSDAKPFLSSMQQLATRVGNTQAETMNANNLQAQQQWTDYQHSFRPNELETGFDAHQSPYLNDADRAQLASILTGSSGMNDHDRALELDRIDNAATEGAATQAATQARATAASSFAQQGRQLARMGGDPSRIALAAATYASNQTANEITAANTARQQAVDRGVTLRSGFANAGRNFPNTAAQAYGTANMSGNSAVGNSSAAATATLPYSQYVSGGYGSQMQAGQIGSQAALGMGNVLNQGYGITSGLAASQNQLAGQNAAGFGQAIGSFAAGVKNWASASRGMDSSMYAG